jgi:hypothetical protein
MLDELIRYEDQVLKKYRREQEPFTLMSRTVIDEFMEAFFKPESSGN